jgi:hypothetical protein
MVEALRKRRGPVRALLPVLRRLHAAELVHLRAHAARLERENARLEADNDRLRREADWADDRAEMFQHALDQVEGHRLSLTRSGDLIVTPNPKV